jgi:ATP-dependent Clp protease ATP-binding subunit ClpA
MSTLALLDPTKTGRQAEYLEKQLHHFIVGQEEAIHQIVRAYQTHVAGLSPVGRPIEKRAIERLLVHPLSNLMASGQIHRGDRIRVSHQERSTALLFSREREEEQAWGASSRAA